MGQARTGYPEGTWSGWSIFSAFKHVMADLQLLEIGQRWVFLWVKVRTFSWSKKQGTEGKAGTFICTFLRQILYKMSLRRLVRLMDWAAAKVILVMTILPPYCVPWSLSPTSLVQTGCRLCRINSCPWCIMSMWGGGEPSVFITLPSCQPEFAFWHIIFFITINFILSPIQVLTRPDPA